MDSNCYPIDLDQCLKLLTGIDNDWSFVLDHDYNTHIDSDVLCEWMVEYFSNDQIKAKSNGEILKIFSDITRVDFKKRFKRYLQETTDNLEMPNWLFKHILEYRYCYEYDDPSDPDHYIKDETVDKENCQIVFKKILKDLMSDIGTFFINIDYNNPCFGYDFMAALTCDCKSWSDSDPTYTFLNELVELQKILF